MLVFLIVAFFCFYHVGRASINNDAHFWYTRTQNFMRAVRIRRWNETYQNPKPGVSVMWLSGVSLETFLNLYNKFFGFKPDIYTYDTFPLVHLSVVGPLLLVVLSSLLLFYLILKKYQNQKAVVLGLVLVGFQPFFVGISRNFHADATLTAFMLMSCLTALYFLLSKPKQKYMIISGVLASLALLSKSSAVFMFPFMAFLFLIDLFLRKRQLLFYVKSYAVWFLSLSLFFFAVFPAMWFKPIEILKRIFLYEGMFLVTTGRDGISGPLYYMEPIVRILSPTFLVFFLIGVVFLIIKFSKIKKGPKAGSTFGVWFCVFLCFADVSRKAKNGQISFSCHSLCRCFGWLWCLLPV